MWERDQKGGRHDRDGRRRRKSGDKSKQCTVDINEIIKNGLNQLNRIIKTNIFYKTKL